MAACSTPKSSLSGSDSTTSNEAGKAAVNASPPASDEAVANPQIEAAQTAATVTAQMQALRDESVYFDFDKSLVKPEFHSTIQKHAEFMMQHKDVVETLEGNADERGSSEYNLALSSRRANSVRKALELAGVSPAQIKTVSLGEQKPRELCHEERCWKENRRVDFVAGSHP